MEYQILSITQLNTYLARKLESDPVLAQVAVRGEISNYKVYPSGHHYFTLKDENSALKCVMFKGNAFRLRFRPENGMKIIAIGSVAVYLRDGNYQLNCTSLTPDGVGDLYTAFEQLKKSLAAKGLFDPAHKKPIPQFPHTIGIITSSAGAAVHDILRILSKRYPLANARLFPVRVQGIEAPEEICSAIRYANRHHLADLLIVGRGGGSLEDLWAFNDERVAHAIYESDIPIISAVGHEPDVTIADYVSDLRAATPSNAAELAVPDRSALHQRLDDVYSRMTNVMVMRVRNYRRRYELLSKSSVLRDPSSYIDLRKNLLLRLRSQMAAAAAATIQQQRQQYVRCAAKLDAMSPLKVISRGYAIITAEKNASLVRSVHNVDIGDTISIRVNDGSIYAAALSTEEK